MKQTSIPSLIVLGLLSPAAFAADAVNYTDHVRPILQQSCFSCHNQDKKKGGLNLATFDALMAGGSSGAIVTSQDPDDSVLLGVMTHAMSPKMPPKGDKLPDAQLEVIRKWIDQGLRASADGAIKKRKTPKVDLSVGKSAIGRPKGPAIMPRSLPLGPIHHTPRPGAVDALAGHPWSPMVAVAGQKQVLIYHTQTGELLGVMPFPAGQPETLRFSWTGKLLMVGGGVGGKSGTVILYDVLTGEEVSRVGDEVDAVLAADLDPTQRYVALGGPSKLVKGFDVATGEMIYKIDKHTEWVTAIAFSPDGKYLATGDRNGGLMIWEADSGMPVFTLDGHKGEVTALSWRFDGKVLASSGDDGQVKTWEMNDGRQVKAWGAHTGGARSVVFAESGRLVTTGRDQRVKVWKDDGARLHEIHAFKEQGLSAAFDTTGTVVVAGDLDGNLVRWSLEDKATRVDTWSSNPPPVKVVIQRSIERVSATAGELKAAQAFSAQKHAEVKQANEALAAVRQALVDAKAALPAAEKALKDRENDRRLAQQERDKASKVHRDARTATGKAKNDLRARENELNRARGDHKTGERDVERATGELRKMVERAEQSAKQAQEKPDDANAKKRAEDDARKVESLSKALQQKTAELDKRSERLATTEKKVAAAKTEVTAKQAVEKQAQQQVEAKAAGYDKANKAITEARKLIDVSRRAIRPAEDRIKPATDHQAKAVAVAAVADEKLAIAKEAANRAVRELAKWRAAEVGMELSELNAQLAKAEAETSAKKIATIKQQIVELTKRYEALRVNAQPSPPAGSAKP